MPFFVFMFCGWLLTNLKWINLSFFLIILCSPLLKAYENGWKISNHGLIVGNSSLGFGLWHIAKNQQLTSHHI
jgi:hypothetical protein